MKRQLVDSFINAITSGNRPIRIFFFGGVFIAYFTMIILADIFGVNAAIGGNIDLSSAILMAISLLIGFGISYSIIHFADVIKRQHTENKRQ